VFATAAMATTARLRNADEHVTQLRALDEGRQLRSMAPQIPDRPDGRISNPGRSGRSRRFCCSRASSWYPQASAQTPAVRETTGDPLPRSL
jgi:hypothetical protein